MPYITKKRVSYWEIYVLQVDSTASKLSSVGVYVKKGAQSANFIRSKRNAEVATQGTVFWQIVQQRWPHSNLFM